MNIYIWMYIYEYLSLSVSLSLTYIKVYIHTYVTHSIYAMCNTARLFTSVLNRADYTHQARPYDNGMVNTRAASLSNGHKVLEFPQVLEKEKQAIGYSKMFYFVRERYKTILIEFLTKTRSASICTHLRVSVRQL